MINFKRTRNRILYSQNMYETFDISYEYSDSIKMKASDHASYDDDELDEFEKNDLEGGDVARHALFRIEI